MPRKNPWEEPIELPEAAVDPETGDPTVAEVEVGEYADDLGADPAEEQLPSPLELYQPAEAAELDDDLFSDLSGAELIIVTEAAEFIAEKHPNLEIVSATSQSTSQETGVQIVFRDEKLGLDITRHAAIGAGRPNAASLTHLGRALVKSAMVEVDARGGAK